ncbi:MAG TPA: alpha/beta hydrolase [Candidatus Limnocylindrales bacterium]|nr:alpha/beta hydrolase [Candidatus Limnocylindrales bacterium]
MTLITLPDGNTLRVEDSGPGDRPVLVWHNGSPHTGGLLDPVVAAAAERGMRVVTYARPSYGGSTPRPGRTVADAARDVAALADELGLGSFHVVGASGGGPHALACAALLPNRVRAVATFASPAPYTDAYDWFGGMQAPGALRAALEGGRPARATFAKTDEFDEAQFVAADWAALAGAWGAVGSDASAADAAGPDGLVDDDVAFTRPWGFDLDAVRAPVLVVQGAADRVIPRSHGQALARALPQAELRLLEGEGHVSVLRHLPASLDWLLARP